MVPAINFEHLAGRGLTKPPKVPKYGMGGRRYFHANAGKEARDPRPSYIVATITKGEIRRWGSVQNLGAFLGACLKTRNQKPHNHAALREKFDRETTSG